KHLDEGRQGYIVCPLVEEGELEGVLSATEYYNAIKDGAFKGYRLGLLHGQMKPAEKSAVMEKFQSGEIQLLVSTVVIEVGVDVPNAVIMLIENAERFGLSQLHQLRGRVGRGSFKSTCILLTDNMSEQTTERLKVMTETNDGFLIAQRDLELRGTGDFYGTRQHGFQPVYVSDMIHNPVALEKATAAADALLAEDANLTRPEHLALRAEVDSLFERIETAS
ncbi:MAG: ATP-dependent DNA helicase RecG, partial [Clostridia bacterium]|nr:ATP-dependent DNA helicase RecG [Clostridia bacterium]